MNCTLKFRIIEAVGYIEGDALNGGQFGKVRVLGTGRLGASETNSTYYRCLIGTGVGLSRSGMAKHTSSARFEGRALILERVRVGNAFSDHQAGSTRDLRVAVEARTQPEQASGLWGEQGPAPRAVQAGEYCGWQRTLLGLGGKLGALGTGGLPQQVQGLLWKGYLAPAGTAKRRNEEKGFIPEGSLDVRRREMAKGFRFESFSFHLFFSKVNIEPTYTVLYVLRCYEGNQSVTVLLPG